VALREPLIIPQGKSWTGPVWALLDHDGAAVDLTGLSVRSQVRESVGDPTVLHEWTTERGNVEVSTATVSTIVDGVATDVLTAAVALRVHPVESAAWEWRTGVYDVEVHDSTSAVVWSVVRPSPVRVEAEVTRG
jgi:hypothetical protein